jgi:hypothetical protein
MQVYREIRQTGLIGKIFKFVFFTFNGLMTFWLIAYWLKVSEPHPSTGATLGIMMGTMFILFFWGIGAGVTGLLMMMTRGPKTLVQSRTGAEATKKRLDSVHDEHSALATRQSDNESTTMEKSRSWTRTEKIVIFGLGLLALAFLGKIMGPPSESHGTPAVGLGTQKVTMTNFNWTRGGFDTVMMLDFTIRNDNDYAVKDFTIKCQHSSPSGTHIDQNTRTVYERLSAHESRSWQQFSMGFIHSQVSKSNCKVVHYVAAS